MEDIIIISSQKSQAAELWVSYLKTCFEKIRKNRNKPPFRILSIAIEDIDDRTPMSPVLETKLRQARLEIVIMCPVFLDLVLQYPERSCKLAAHLQPANVLTMLLGIDQSSVTEEHRAALVSFARWRKMESVKDRDEKFVSDFLGAAMEILARTPTKSNAAPAKSQFMLVPKKVNQHQKKVIAVLTEPLEKEDVIRVSIMRNGEDLEVGDVVRRNPYTLAFRVPEIYLGLTCLVSIRIVKNGQELGSKQLKCESQLHALEQVLRGCDQPLDFTCQALNIIPSDKAKLDEVLLKAFQRNVPPHMNLLQSAGSAHIPHNANSKEEMPTLLHFAARFGLEQLCWALLECPGGDRACETRNCNDLTPAEIAEAAGHARLSSLLSGYMQMSQFSSAYAFLKGMVDGKENVVVPNDEYMNPRPVLETYQVPPSPRPCPVAEVPVTPHPPPHGYMPMKSPLGRIPAKSADILNDEKPEDLGYARERLLYRSNSDEPRDNKQKNGPSNNAAEDELIEIINDFKNNVFTIGEVEALVNQWRRRNDVQQSFREKQEHLTKLRKEYDRVQQRLKEEMGNVERPSPIDRIRNFFKGKPKETKETKESKRKMKAEKKRIKEEGSPRPASSLSILSSSSSSSSSGRLSTASGGSLADSASVANSEPESERRYMRHPYDENYDIPPAPISVVAAVHSSEAPVEPVHMTADCHYVVPPSPIELASTRDLSEYCNMHMTADDHAAKPETKLKTVMEEDRKTDNSYMNVSGGGGGEGASAPLIIIEHKDLHLPEYVNVETQCIQLKCN